MKILLLTDGIYPYVMGGMQKHSFYLIKYLARKGVEVDVAHCIHDDNFPDNYDDNFTKDELVNINFYCYRFPSLGRMPGHYIKENYKYSSDVYKDFSSKINEYDVIYIQGFSGWKFIENGKKGVLETPTLINFHGVEMFQKAPSLKVKLQHYLLRGPAKWNITNADYVFSFGGHFVEIFKKLKVSDDKILEMPIGIESSWLNDTLKVNPKRKFIFIGRYERRKGIEELNEALKILNSDQYEFEFIGPIPDDKKLNLSTCKYHGAIYDQEKIKKILRNGDVLVCPSHSEGMPTVIMEAMASGLAIIATDVGAVQKQIDGNGWLLKEPKVGLIKNALIEAINIGENELKALKEKSVEIIKQKFLWSKVADQLISFIEKIKN